MQNRVNHRPIDKIAGVAANIGNCGASLGRLLLHTTIVLTNCRKMPDWTVAIFRQFVCLQWRSDDLCRLCNAQGPGGKAN